MSRICSLLTERSEAANTARTWLPLAGRLPLARQRAPGFLRAASDALRRSEVWSPEASTHRPRASHWGCTSSLALLARGEGLGLIGFTAPRGMQRPEGASLIQIQEGVVAAGEHGRHIVAVALRAGVVDHSYGAMVA